MRIHHVFWLTGLILLIGPGLNTRLHASDVPDIVLQTKQERQQLSELRVQVVYLEFWASWCGTCRKSFPWMNELHLKRFTH